MKVEQSTSNTQRVTGAKPKSSTDDSVRPLCYSIVPYYKLNIYKFCTLIDSSIQYKQTNSPSTLPPHHPSGRHPQEDLDGKGQDEATGDEIADIGDVAGSVAQGEDDRDGDGEDRQNDEGAGCAGLLDLQEVADVYQGVDEEDRDRADRRDLGQVKKDHKNDQDRRTDDEPFAAVPDVALIHLGEFAVACQQYGSGVEYPLKLCYTTQKKR